jgi:hypothetical protein
VPQGTAGIDSPTNASGQAYVVGTRERIREERSRSFVHATVCSFCRELNDAVVGGGGDDDRRTVLTEQPMVQADAGRMIRRPAVAAGIKW